MKSLSKEQFEIRPGYRQRAEEVSQDAEYKDQEKKDRERRGVPYSSD